MRCLSWRCPWMVLSLCLLGATALPGCQYHTQELYPQQYRTVAIPLFENRSFYRGVEYDLAEALVKEIELRTPYKVTAPGAADTLLQGTIVRVEQRMRSRHRPGGVPESMEVAVTVDFEWKDLRSGQILRSRQGFTAVGAYIPTAPVSQPFEVAQHMAVTQLAQEMVSTLQADW